MLLLKRFNYYIIVLLFFTQLGCSSHQNDNNQDYPDSIIYDEDFGFCGYISCVDIKGTNNEKSISQGKSCNGLNEKNHAMGTGRYPHQRHKCVRILQRKQ